MSYGYLKLPEIKDNICEGVIIKPVMPQFLHNGSRIIIKNKNAKWSEKSKVKTKGGKQVKLSDKAETLLLELERFINPNRLTNVISMTNILFRFM